MVHAQYHQSLYVYYQRMKYLLQYLLEWAKISGKEEEEEKEDTKVQCGWRTGTLMAVDRNKNDMATYKKH